MSLYQKKRRDFEVGMLILYKAMIISKKKMVSFELVLVGLFGQ